MGKRFKDLSSTMDINLLLGAAENADGIAPGNKFTYSKNVDLNDPNPDAVVPTQAAVKAFSQTYTEAYALAKKGYDGVTQLGYIPIVDNSGGLNLEPIPSQNPEQIATFYYRPGGNDINSGKTIEDAFLTPETAANSAFALLAPCMINGTGASNYTDKTISLAFASYFNAPEHNFIFNSGGSFVTQEDAAFVCNNIISSITIPAIVSGAFSSYNCILKANSIVANTAAVNGVISSSVDGKLLITAGTFTSSAYDPNQIILNISQNSLVTVIAPNMCGRINIVASPGTAKVFIYTNNPSLVTSNNMSIITFCTSGITGDGTIGTIAKFSATNTISDSVVTETGGNITIGTGSSISKLNVYGTNGVTISDVSNPRLYLYQSTIAKKVFGVATNNNAFFIGAVPNDSAIRNETAGSNILLGIGAGSFTAAVNATGLGLLNKPSFLFDSTPTSIGTKSFSRPYPTLNNAQQALLTGMLEGCGIWNSEQHALRIYSNGAWSAIDSPSVINVYYLSDLPTAIGGKISLADNAVYKFSPSFPITTTSKIELGSHTIIDNAIITCDAISFRDGVGGGSSNIYNSSLTLTSALDVLNYNGSSSSKVIRLESSNIVVSGIDATVFNFTSSSNYTLILKELAILGASTNNFKLGTISKATITSSNVNFLSMQYATGGIIFSNCNNIILENWGMLNSPTSGTELVLLSFTGIQQAIQLEKIILNNTNANIYAYNFSGTFNAAVSNHMGQISDRAKAFAVGSYTQKTPNFNFIKVGNIPSSTVTSEIYYTNGVNLTSVPGQDIYTMIANAAYVLGNEERTSNDLIYGVVTFTGIETRKLKANAIVTMEDAGSNKLLYARFGKLDSLSRVVTFYSVAHMVLLINHGFSDGDQVRLTNTGGLLPTGLRDDIFYYVVGALTDSFQVSYTLGGGSINFTTLGTGTSYVNKAYYVGGESGIRVSSGDPLSSSPQSLVEMNTGDKLVVLVKNSTDGNGVYVRKLYKTLVE